MATKASHATHVRCFIFREPAIPSCASASFIDAMIACFHCNKTLRLCMLAGQNVAACLPVAARVTDRPILTIPA
jgi:hypothetical protein